MFKFFSSLDRRLAIDLGSCRTRLWLDQEELILAEASALTIDIHKQKLVAAGDEALQMEGRVRSPLRVFHPVHQPKIKDERQLSAMLKAFFQEASNQAYFFNPTVVLSLATEMAPVVKERVVQVVTNLGAKEVLVVAQPLAAAIGSGVPVADASGCFLLHLGGGVVEAAAISLGKIIRSETATRAGLALDTKIQHLLRQKHQLLISKRIARHIKHQLGALHEMVGPGQEREREKAGEEAESHHLLVTGNDLNSGSPREIKLSARELQPLLFDFADQCQQLVQALLSQAPPDLTTDILDKGLLLSGGLAQLPGLDQYLVENLGVPVSVVEEPEQVVIQGLGVILAHLSEFKQSLGYN
jgi:rod shape-determining protein MreB